jgi:NTE family protein
MKMFAISTILGFGFCLNFIFSNTVSAYETNENANIFIAKLSKSQLPSNDDSIPVGVDRGPKVINNPSPSRHNEVNATEVRDAGVIREEESDNNKKELDYKKPPLKLITAPNNGSFRIAPRLDRKTMALALGGGGARGAAHIGVLRVFERENIPIDYIVGNSMGAVVGGLYCAGVDLDTLEKYSKDGSLRKAYLPKLFSVLLIPVTKIVPCKNKYAGLSSGRKYEKKLLRAIPEECRSFENMRIPFSAVATNLLDGNAYRISDGDLACAIKASSAISPLIKPVKIGDKLYVDGGMRANLPASAARDTGADIVIAVLVDEPLRELPEKTFRSYKKIAERLADVILAVTDEHQLQFADIIINPDVSGINILSRKQSDVEKAIAAGEAAAEKALPLIRKKLGLAATQTKLSVGKP